MRLTSAATADPLALGHAVLNAPEEQAEAPAGPWVAAFHQACRQGLEWSALDRYGRWLGRLRWQPAPDGGRRLIELQAPHGALWRLRPALQSSLQSLHPALPLQMGRQALRVRSAASLLRRLRAPTPQAPLHPVLAGMAHDEAAQVRTLGQAVTLLAGNPRHVDLPLSELRRRVRRAQGSGQLRLWLDAAGEAEGLLIWARPGEPAREALAQGHRVTLHAAEWNEGGPLVALDFCACNPQAAAQVAAALVALPEPQEPALHLRLSRVVDGRASVHFERVSRADLPALQAWLSAALARESETAG
jgi:hemolysin-activating ACP:hemolysin acyltransferase